MDEFAWKRAEAVLYAGIMLAVAGSIGVVAFFFVKRLSER